MSDGYYSWKYRRARLVKEAEELGVSTVGSNNQLASRIFHARRGPVEESVVELPDPRVSGIRRRDRAAAERLVARCGRGRFAEPGGYANPREAFNDLYGEL